MNKSELIEGIVSCMCGKSESIILRLCTIQKYSFGSDLDSASVTSTRLSLVFCNDDKEVRN